MKPPRIHPTAVIHPDAQLAPDVTVGPYSVIDAHVTIGAGTVLGAHVYLTGWTVLGKNNRLHQGAVLGHEPQDLAYEGSETLLVVGDGNVFREYVTVHRGASKDDRVTRIGHRNYFMVGSHVGHNATVANDCVLANNALLGGHVTLEDKVVIGGGTVVHQFVRIGRLAILRGGIAVGKDVPPFCMVTDVNYVGGLNTVGLRRAGFSPQTRSALKAAFRLLYRSGLNVQQALEKIRAAPATAEVHHFADFIAASQRGLCAGAKWAGIEEDTQETLA